MSAPVPGAVSPDVAALLGQAEATCQLWAEQDEGPYRGDVHPTRRDVTEDRDGVRLALGLVLGGEWGTPPADGTVEIWHCDAAGRYSGFPPPAGAPHTEYVRGQTFLRGSQPTDSAGRVEFRTIYPGWYPGRTVHIHGKVHLDKRTVLTTQFYFDEEITKQVYTREPYASRPGRQVLNDGDQLFDDRLLLRLRRDGDGWLGSFSADVAKS